MIERQPRAQLFALLTLGHLLFLGLFILAYIHTMPRVVHVDSAFQIFKWIHGEGVGVEAHRFTAIVPQLLVKLAATCGWALPSLLTLASLVHVLVPYLLFVLIGYVLRAPWHAMALVLAQVLCTRLTFYGIVLEANYLLCYPFLLAAVLHGPLQRSQRPPVIGLALAALLLVLCVHPVGFLVALFVLVLVRLQGHPAKGVLYGLMLFTLTWPFLSRVLFPPTGYEAGLYAATSEGLQRAGGDQDLPALRFLLQHSGEATGHYLVLWGLLTVLLVLQFRRRAYAELGWCLLAVVGYVALNALTYHQGETAMMMEKNFLPLAVAVALPLLLEVERSPSIWRWWSFGLLTAVIFVQFRGISFAARPARERLAKIEDLVQQCRAGGVHKACATPTELDAKGLHIHWALAFETMLVSAYHGPAHCVSVVAREVCPPTITGADLSGLIDEGAICAGGTHFFRLPIGPYAVLSAR